MSVARRTHPVFTIGRNLDELFVQQYDRIAFHNNEKDNAYRHEENQLSSLIVDRALPSQTRIEHAQAILALADKYEASAIRALNELNDNIDQHLAAFEQAFESVFCELDDMAADAKSALRHDLQQWLSLSKELQTVRIDAGRTIAMRVECDRYLPTVLIQNQGNLDVSFTPEETAWFQKTLEDAVETLKRSSEGNDRIESERIPLSKKLFFGDSTNDSRPTQTQHAPAETKTVKPIHPLEGKAWFRLMKVLYICLCVSAGAISLLIAASAEGGTPALILGAISAVLLILLRKGFYYVTLGRTTVAEQPGTGYLDWDELNASFEDLKSTDPEGYETAVKPFLASWKQQYGRRVPVGAFEVLRNRVKVDLEQLNTKKQQAIEDAAKKGVKLEISSIRKNIEKAKAEYQGPDRAAHIRALDAFIMKLEATYGTSIPFDDAARLLEELDQKA